MAKFALIAEGAIKRFGLHDTKPDPNPAKGYAWLPVEETPQPDISGRLEIATAEYVVERNQVVRRWTVTRRPIADQRQAVKDEARRRILDRFPEWKQANMTARGVELAVARIAREWVPEEKDEADAIQATWNWVKAVRSASDAIEALSPIPADFRDAKHWPE